MTPFPSRMCVRRPGLCDSTPAETGNGAATTEKKRSASKSKGSRLRVWVFPKIGASQNGWFIMENLIKMDDLRVPLFSETSVSKKDWGRISNQPFQQEDPVHVGFFLENEFGNLSGFFTRKFTAGS